MRAVLVTGASRGIGAGLVSRLSGRAELIVAACRNPAKMPKLPGVLPLELDVADEASVMKAAATFKEQGMPLDLIINNAGVMHPSGRGEVSIGKVNQDDFMAVLAVNLVGPALVVKHFLPFLKRSKDEASGKVVQVAAGVGSLAGNKAGGWYSYRIAKTGLNQLTRTMAIELQRHNVICAGLYPRMVDTDLSKTYQKSNPYGVLRTPEETADKMLETIDSLKMQPLGRFIDIWTEEDIPW
eukprot:gnl/MRDRNA2_/MRDRNA2_122460_c0_seq1.p1 gnl/MRDRNA2_/MRDRNA2_122460_c0~~gnl/MRDRNA2_/MRDRNA2_122460_c0_seq1.p1  ORF type:complete len:240 (+),score=45.84 gnl/MRDRNA2_/MRDRNA2_122460_c0_seq1:58-777(+)